MSGFVHHRRFAPVARATNALRKRLPTGGLSAWLAKAVMRHALRRKSRPGKGHDPAGWRAMWDADNFDAWASAPVTGIVEIGDIKLVIDRSEITGGGYLWLDGWVLGLAPASMQIEAAHCTIGWQATFATSRPDVVSALQLSLVGRDANVGVQILARIPDYVPGTSRIALTSQDIALTSQDGGAAPRTVVIPVVPQIERSGSVWHSVYDAMRHRGPRDVAYLNTSVSLLKDLRKADWRERTAAICRSIEEAMPQGPAMKVLVLSRLHPNVAYLNVNLLAAARLEPADFLVCSMGQHAIQRANEYRTQFATIGPHGVGFVNAEIGTPSCELIEQFARSCQERRCPGLVVYDDVAVASAMGSLSKALRDETRQETGHAVAWSRRFPDVGQADLAFTEPLGANDGPGPYWRSASAMQQGTLGAVLFGPGGLEVPAIPPFEGRGYGLEYLLKSTLANATMADETMLDLIEPAGQREAQGLDMLMLLAS